MNNIPYQSNSSSIDTIFAQLDQDDIEEFYFGYQYWKLHQWISTLQIQIADIQRQIAENTQRMQEVQPTAIALATLARLQSNGVSDIALLDRMLEQGELWLDRTMQRLEYFEQLGDFISDDYTKWCQRALDGAYDWIDSMLGSSSPLSSPVVTPEEEKLTEEIFLQKLSSDDYEDESSLLEATLKRPAITYAPPSEPPLPSEEIPVAPEITPHVEEASPALEENFPGEVMPTTTLSVEANLNQEFGEADITQEREEEPPVESSTISYGEQPSKQEFVEIPRTIEDSPAMSLEILQQRNEHPASEVLSPDSTVNEVHLLSRDPEAHEQNQKNETLKRPNVIMRFMGRIWGNQT